MKPIFLHLEDGAVFEGRSVSEALECGGLLSFYTGVVGYQEVITDPANLGKIVLFTYPLIGNYGVNPEDAESASPKVAGVLCKEYPPYYSNFRATGNLKDYLASGGIVFGQGFDTRAILLYLRENGEMKAVVSHRKLEGSELSDRIAAVNGCEYEPENRPAKVEGARLKAATMDLGASRSFFRHMASLGVEDGHNPNDADLIIISDAPYFTVEDDGVISQVNGWLRNKPVIGFGHGAAIVAKAAGARAKWMKFGHHGVNIPVSYVGGGRNEITVQNHNYEVQPNGVAQVLFTNVHDGTCEGFKCTSTQAAGVNFLPDAKWFDLVLDAVGVKTNA